MSERDTIPATCPRCGRPRASVGCEYTVHACFAALDPGTGVWSDVCLSVYAAYHRGIAAGLALAKEHAFASVGYQHGYPTAHIEWHEVDAAATATEK